MMKVTKEEFYGPIFRNRLNVHPRIVNDKWPYTSIFMWLSNPNREPYGKIVGRREGAFEVKDYFVTEKMP